MEQKVERKPLLSEDGIELIVGTVSGESTAPDKETPNWMETDIRNGALAARDFYEGLLDRGELVIPKTVKRGKYCEHCGAKQEEHRFCHWCGARIID